MARIVLNVKALKWGNSYGLRVGKRDFERAGLHVGQEVEIQIGGQPGKVDVSHVRTFRSGDPSSSQDHDEILYVARLEGMARSGSISKAELGRERKRIEGILKRRNGKRRRDVGG